METWSCKCHHESSAHCEVKGLERRFGSNAGIWQRHRSCVVEGRCHKAPVRLGRGSLLRKSLLRPSMVSPNPGCEWGTLKYCPLCCSGVTVFLQTSPRGSSFARCGAELHQEQPPNLSSERAAGGTGGCSFLHVACIKAVGVIQHPFILPGSSKAPRNEAGDVGWGERG